MTTHAVLDVGGTSIKLGAVCDGEVVVDTAVPTLAAADADTVFAQLRTAAHSALRLAERTWSSPVGMAVAFPGPFDLDAGVAHIRGQAKFDAIHGLPIRPALDLGGLPIGFARDSEAVGVGEAVFGAGAGHSRVLTLALGTGLGSCLTVDGRPVESLGGPPLDELYRRTTPEGRADDVLSARGLAALLRVAPGDLGTVLAATGSPSDARVDAAIETFGRRLGAFVESVADELGPDLVVVAGGLAASFDRFAPGIEATTGVACRPATKPSTAALLGAVRLVFP